MVWTPRVTVAAIIEQDGHFLMVEEHVGKKQSAFNQPAGHLEEGESLLQAVSREVLEETAYPLTAESISGIYRWIAPTGDTYLRVCFCGSVGSPISQALDDDIIASHWLTLEQIESLGERLRSPLVIDCIKDYLANQRYPLSLFKEPLSR